MSSPITNYPEVAIGDKTYRLKFGLRAVMLMKQWEVPQTVQKDDLEGYWAFLVGHLAAGACSEQDGKLKNAGLSRQDVRDIYDDDPDITELTRLGAAIDLAVSFHMPSGASQPQPETAKQE